jgi:hypothetical protein
VDLVDLWHDDGFRMKNRKEASGEAGFQLAGMAEKGGL